MYGCSSNDDDDDDDDDNEKIKEEARMSFRALCMYKNFTEIRSRGAVKLTYIHTYILYKYDL